MAAEPGPESVADARQAVVDARLAVEKELDDLGLATQAAFDIPAKITGIFEVELEDAGVQLASLRVEQ